MCVCSYFVFGGCNLLVHVTYVVRGEIQRESVSEVCDTPLFCGFVNSGSCERTLFVCCWCCQPPPTAWALPQMDIYIESNCVFVFAYSLSPVAGCRWEEVMEMWCGWWRQSAPLISIRLCALCFVLIVSKCVCVCVVLHVSMSCVRISSASLYMDPGIHRTANRKIHIYKPHDCCAIYIRSTVFTCSRAFVRSREAVRRSTCEWVCERVCIIFNMGQIMFGGFVCK